MGTLTEGQTKPGMIIGTIPYMSPEQASGQRLVARSDIFSFGSVLYATLSGRTPLEGASSLEILHRGINAEPAPLADDIPLGLRMRAEKALEKEPAERYQSMRELTVGLKRLARQRGEQPLCSNRPDGLNQSYPSFRPTRSLPFALRQREGKERRPSLEILRFGKQRRHAEADKGSPPGRCRDILLTADRIGDRPAPVP